MSIFSEKAKELRDLGMSNAEIGAAINLAPSTVSDLICERYKTPRYESACLLNSLHAEKTKRPTSKSQKKRAA